MVVLSLVLMLGSVVGFLSSRIGDEQYFIQTQREFLVPADAYGHHELCVIAGKRIYDTKILSADSVMRSGFSPDDRARDEGGLEKIIR